MTCPKGQPSIFIDHDSRPTPASQPSSHGNRFSSVLCDPMRDGRVHVRSYQARAKFGVSSSILVPLQRRLQMKSSCKTCKTAQVFLVLRAAHAYRLTSGPWRRPSSLPMAAMIDCDTGLQLYSLATAVVDCRSVKHNWISHPNSASLRETPSPPLPTLLGLSFEENLAVWLRSMCHARVELCLSRFSG